MAPWAKAMMEFTRSVIGIYATTDVDVRSARDLWARVPIAGDSRGTSNTSERAGPPPSRLPPTAATIDQERYGVQIRTGQIQELIKLAPHSAATHMAVAAAIYWLWAGQPRNFLVPFCIMVLLTEALVLFGKSLFDRAEPTQRVVEIACRCAEVLAFIQGLTWGSMPIALLSDADNDHRILAVAIVTGLIGGIFVIGSITRITILFVVPLVGGSFMALVLDSRPSSLMLAALLAIYSLFVLASVLPLNGLAKRRILDRLRVDDQRQTIGLLLNDFEENTSDWLWETDRMGRLIHVSDRMAQAARLASSLLLHRTFDEIFASGLTDTHVTERHALAGAMATPAAFRDLAISFTRQDLRHWWSLSGKPLFDSSGGFVGFRGVGSDITQAMAAQERIAYLVNYDPLTGLTNRALFHESLARALKTHDASSLAVLYVDLDDFKIVNDTFGHGVGDEVLRHVADRLRASVPPDTLSARLGGDEFAVLLRRTSQADALALARTLIGVLGESCQCDGPAVAIGASVGIAMGTAETSEPEIMLHKADLALYEAKSHGKGSFVCFESTLERTVGARLAMQGEIKHAIARNEMVVHYQPILCGRSREVVGFEALLRWTSPHRGRVPPVEFIAAAEACGAIVAIGAWTLKQACLQASQWPLHIRIAVNLSPLQCRSSDLVGIVSDALAVSGLTPNRLELEITESVLLATTATVEKNITELKQMGVRLALDDFGTGFSSLSYLLKFPFDKIKIDKCFVQELPTRLECVAVVDAVIGLAKRLGVTVTAEGVETAEQARYLARRSCEELQGFLFSPALAADELDGLLARGFADDEHETTRHDETSRPWAPTLSDAVPA